MDTSAPGIPLPTGTVTFLFTDLEGSTRLWEERAESMRSALARHDRLLRDAVAAHDGVVVKGMGDGIHAAFPTPEGAVAAAAAAQHALGAERWIGVAPLRVRMGIHTGSSEVRDGDYFGPAVNRAARVMQAAHGGQILVSGVVEELTRATLPAGVTLRPLGAFALRGFERPERLLQVVGDGLEVDFPDPRTADHRPGNLPLPTTSFVGRDDELHALAVVLETDRVVTLTGVGGVGKTRLAVEVAAAIADRFPDGVWLCELGPVSDGAAVADVLAAVLGVQPRPGAGPVEMLVEALRERSLLIVLDNCEHVIGTAASAVESIVRTCDGVRVLATSREGLGTSGERLVMVRSLALPDPDRTTDAARDSAAVQLFTDRATAARRDFALTADNLGSVVQICRRLDGIPLAIELAAARVRSLSPTEIAERLDERFRLLTGGTRTAVERHQTLRAAVDWSYDLLEPAQQSVFDRLGVFAGGFTLAGAEAVAGTGDADVLDALAQLVDKSLVLAEEDPDGTTRYRLLETIRQYAVAHLDDAGTIDAIRRRHADWLVGFVAASSAHCQGPDDVAWAGRVGRELENLRAALTWATGTGASDVAMDLLGPLEVAHWPNSPMLFALGPWADAALATPGALGHRDAPSVLALRAADHLLHDRIDDAEQDALDAMVLAQRAEHRFSPYPWGVLVRIYALTERETILEHYAEGVDAARARGTMYEQAMAHTLAAMTLVVANRFEEAPQYSEPGLDLARASGASTAIAFALSAAAQIEAERDPARALALAVECVELAVRNGHGMNMLVALNLVGRLGAAAGNPDWAMRFRTLLDQTDAAGDRRMVRVMVVSMVYALITAGAYETAAVLFGVDLPAWTPLARARHESSERRLRAELGDERFLVLATRGRALTLDDAAALMRTELDRIIDGATR